LGLHALHGVPNPPESTPTSRHGRRAATPQSGRFAGISCRPSAGDDSLKIVVLPVRVRGFAAADRIAGSPRGTRAHSQTQRPPLPGRRRGGLDAHRSSFMHSSPRVPDSTGIGGHRGPSSHDPLGAAQPENPGNWAFSPPSCCAELVDRTQEVGGSSPPSSIARDPHGYAVLCFRSDAPVARLLATWLEYPVGAWLEPRLCHGAGFAFVERFPPVAPAVPSAYEQSRLFAPRAKTASRTTRRRAHVADHVGLINGRPLLSAETERLAARR
jgi:hypothetical protein